MAFARYRPISPWKSQKPLMAAHSIASYSWRPCSYLCLRFLSTPWRKSSGNGCGRSTASTNAHTIQEIPRLRERLHLGMRRRRLGLPAHGLWTVAFDHDQRLGILLDLGYRRADP